MGNNPIVWFVVLVLISTVVGAVAKMLNNLSEANAAKRAEEERRQRATRTERAAARAREAQDERAERPKSPAPAAAPATPHNGGSVRPATSDMDRFLAEIDRLRRKAAANPDPPPTQPGSAPPVAPIVQPKKSSASEKARPRVVAEFADAPAGTPTGGAASFGTSPQAPSRTAPVGGQVEVIPVTQVQRSSSSTGAPATKVTVFTKRPRPASKTNLGMNLTALLASGQGVAMAVVLQEILGPPKSRQHTAHLPPQPAPAPAPPADPPNGEHS